MDRGWTLAYIVSYVTVMYAQRALVLINAGGVVSVKDFPALALAYVDSVDMRARVGAVVIVRTLNQRLTGKSVTLQRHQQSVVTNLYQYYWKRNICESHFLLS